MVVAILVNRIAPSSRGLRRNGVEEAGTSGAKTLPHDNDAYESLDVTASEETAPESTDAAGPRKKPFKAIAALTSLASDLDVISDWLFLRETYKNDQEYRKDLEDNPEPNKVPYLIPPRLLSVLFVVCILGSFMWLVLATDGRFLTPVMKRLGVENISMGYMLLLSVLVEDLPQTVLTFMIEDYYESNGSLSNFAVMNLTVSLYDLLIKLAEAYDERNDIVETGVWCKASIWAHYGPVTAVLALPLPPSANETSSTPSRDMKQSKKPSFIERALKPVAPTELPRLRFLTASEDKTIRLWDTAVTVTGHRRKNCVHKFRGHLDAVACVALLGKTQDYKTVHPEQTDPDLREEEYDHNTFFVSGCKSGNAKLWNLHGDCIRSFYLSSSSDKIHGITSVAIIKEGCTFVCGYEDGTARLWEAWSGICIGAFKGHGEIISSVCSMEDGHLFLTGSHDETIKLWDVSSAMQALSDSTFDDQLDDTTLSKRMLLWSESALHEESVCKRTFLGHSGAIFALACLEPGHTFVSGSADGTARMWSIRKRSCLRIFSEHQGPVRSVVSLDEVTFLTGSDDTTVKAWSALSAESLRTFDGHTDVVTAVSVSQDDTTFLTASADCTVKVWVLTTIPKDEASDDLDDLLDLNDFACAGG